MRRLDVLVFRDPRSGDPVSRGPHRWVGSTWTQQAKLLASDGVMDEGFGASVAIGGDTAVIGSSSHGHLGVFSGSAYVFTRSGSTWTQQDELLAADGAELDYFGSGVAHGVRDVPESGNI